VRAFRVPPSGTTANRELGHSYCRNGQALVDWNWSRRGTLANMFVFFSNRVGFAGSILVSLLITLALLYACSR
jgi:hypothetical protein